MLHFFEWSGIVPIYAADSTRAAWKILSATKIVLKWHVAIYLESMNMVYKTNSILKTILFQFQ